MSNAARRLNRGLVRSRRTGAPEPTYGRDGWRWERREVTDHRLAPAGLQAAYLNRFYSVQVFHQTAKDGLEMTHLMVRRHDAQPIRTWKDLQRIKNELTDPTRVAVEVFPPQNELVDAANILHLWVFPQGVKLGFGLGLSL